MNPANTAGKTKERSKTLLDLLYVELIDGIALSHVSRSTAWRLVQLFYSMISAHRKRVALVSKSIPPLEGYFKVLERRLSPVGSKETAGDFVPVVTDALAGLTISKLETVKHVLTETTFLEDRLEYLSGKSDSESVESFVRILASATSLCWLDPWCLGNLFLAHSQFHDLVQLGVPTWTFQAKYGQALAAECVEYVYREYVGEEASPGQKTNARRLIDVFRETVIRHNCFDPVDRDDDIQRVAFETDLLSRKELNRKLARRGKPEETHTEFSRTPNPSEAAALFPRSNATQPRLNAKI